MNELFQFAIEGFPVGCIYALVAIGLVLTYKTSGVFNLAFGAQAFLSAAVFYQLRVERDWPLWAAFVVAVLVVGPLMGLLLDRLLFRHMRTAPWLVKLISSLGLLVAIPEIVKVFIGKSPRFQPPNIAPLIGIDADHVFHIGDYIVPADKAVTVIFTLGAVIGLGLMFRYTAIGLQMRAVVESPRMVELAGVDSERVSAVSWVLSSLLAAMAGVLLAPLFNAVSDFNFTILIVAASAAAAFGRLTSIPMTLVGGLILGIGQRVIGGYLPLDSVFAQGIRPALPFIVLFLLLIFIPALYKKRDVGDPLKGVDPPPPAVASAYKDDQLRKFTRIAFPVFLVGFALANLFLITDLWVFRFTGGFVLAIIFLSITVFTGLSGQVSLGQAAFAGIGASATGQLATDAGMPVWLALVVGAVIAGVIGGLLAIPALRLGGIFLAIATLAFSLALETIVFPLDGQDAIFGWHANVFGGQIGLDVPRPAGMGGDQAFFLFVFVIFLIVAGLVVLVRNGASGRFLAAMRGSETAAASIGINATKQRILVFAFSAAIAGLGGGLFAMLNRGTSFTDWPTLIGVAWVVLVVSLGVRTVDGAVNAGLAFVLSAWLLTDALELPFELFLIGFGFSAITFAKHPEGIVEYRTRESIQAQVRARRVNARAHELAGAGQWPREFTPTSRVVLPLLPILIFPVYAYLSGWQPFVFAVLVGLPVLWALLWAVRTVVTLRRHGPARSWQGPFALLLGTGLGALAAATGLGLVSDPLDLGTARTALVGAAGGFLVVGLFLIPLAIEHLAAADRRIPTITWRAGRVPALFAAAGVFIWYRTTLDTPPSDLGLLLVAMVGLVILLQWVSTVQASLNEYWVPIEDDEGAVPVTVPPTPEAVPVPAPSGGAE